MEGCTLVNYNDRWVWSLEGSGEFSVSSVRNLIDGFMLPEVSSKTRWIKEVPIKVNVHAWKVKIDCLPTRLNISRRGMDIDSILCPMCDKGWNLLDICFSIVMFPTRFCERFLDGGILSIRRFRHMKNGWIGY